MHGVEIHSQKLPLPEALGIDGALFGEVRLQGDLVSVVGGVSPRSLNYMQHRLGRSVKYYFFLEEEWCVPQHSPLVTSFSPLLLSERAPSLSPPSTL